MRIDRYIILCYRGRPPASSVLARPDHGSRDISQMIAAMSQSADNTMVLDVRLYDSIIRNYLSLGKK